MAPEFGRLIAHVPRAVRIARTHRALLGANRLLVAPDAEKDAGKAALGDQLRFNPSVLRAAARAFGGSAGSVASTGGQGALM